MKFHLAIAFSFFLILNACKSDKTAEATTETAPSEAGIQANPNDTTSKAYALDPTKPTGALPELKKEYCFGAGNTALKIQEENLIIMGTYVAFENGKKIIDGKFLGVFQNDTIKGMVLSKVNDVSKPQDAWFKKDGDNYIALNAATEKDDKGAFKLDPKSLKPGETLAIGACK